MIVLLLKDVLEAHPFNNQLHYSLKAGSIRKQELKPARIIAAWDLMCLLSFLLLMRGADLLKRRTLSG